METPKTSIRARNDVKALPARLFFLVNHSCSFAPTRITKPFNISTCTQLFAIYMQP